MSSDNIGNVLSGILAGNFRIPAELVGLGVRVAIVVSHIRHHGVKNARVRRCRRLVVEVQRHRLRLIRQRQVNFCKESIVNTGYIEDITVLTLTFFGARLKVDGEGADTT